MRGRFLVVLLALIAGVLFANAASASAAPTVVSLTFDDGQCTQYTYLRPVLLNHPNDHVTFYVNTADLDTIGTGLSCRMTWSQVDQLYADGNEIGGHTLDHPDLTTLNLAQAQREVCDDRQALLARGYNATDFAYPFGNFDAQARSVVQSCGYSSARGFEDLTQPGQPGTTFKDSIPPADQWNILASYSIDAGVTLAQLQQYVTRVENSGGGWVVFVIHRVCPTSCDVADAPTPDTIDQFLTWLDGRSAQGTTVKTVQQALAGTTPVDTTPPTTTIHCNGGSCGSGWYNAPVSISLTANDGNGSGVDSIHYTTDGTTPTTASPTYTGPFTVSSNAQVQYRAWDKVGNVEDVKTQQISIDTVPPTSSIQCNGTACASSTYNAAVNVTLSGSDAASGLSAVRYTTDGSDPTATSTAYTSAISVKRTTTIKFRAFDNAGNAEAVHSQTINVDPSVAGKTVVTFTFDDAQCTQWTYVRPILLKYGIHATFFVNSGFVGTQGAGGLQCYMPWSQVEQLYADGNEIGSHSVDHPDFTTLAPDVQQREVCDDVTALRSHGFNVTNFAYPYGAYNDSAKAAVKACGLSSARAFETIPPPPGLPMSDSLPPHDPYATLASFSIGEGVSASDLESYVTRVEDNGGGWVQFVMHRVCPQSVCDAADAADPAALDAFVGWLQQRAPMGTSIADVQEALGDAGTPPADNTPPTSTIQCNGAACGTGTFNAPVSIALSATDAGGSGVDTIRYTTDGSNPTASSTAYTAPFTVASSGQVKYRAFDKAGNAEAVNTQSIVVDTTPPASSIACGGAACGTGFYSTTMGVSLSATDSGGSGVDVIRYTTNGTTPTTTSPAYTAPFNLPNGTQTVRFRAWDKAGNAESTTHSQTIRIDGTAPSSTIRCNGTTCSTGWYTSDPSVTLTSTDGSGSGVSAIRYTLDGSTPTTSSLLYTGPFSFDTPVTVMYRAWDAVGNVETVRSRSVRVDTEHPTVAITSPANGAQVSGTVTIRANATDAVSGVRSVAFRVGSTTITTDTSSPYSANWNTIIPGTYSLTAVATDSAGNTTTSPAVVVTR